MSPIQINVSVELGMSDDVKALLQALLCHRQKAVPAPATVAAPAPEKAEEPEKPTKVEAKKVEGTPAKKIEEAKPSGDDADEEAVRAAMDRARVRIEGEDWQNASSAGRKEWHSAMNSWFKATSALFGAEKPSALPDEESRRRFIECCDRAAIVNGKIQEPIPF